jgi:hypothetical protein
MKPVKKRTTGKKEANEQSGCHFAFTVPFDARIRIAGRWVR